MVWGIASRESYETISYYVDSLGLTYPILQDHDASVNEAYAQEMAFPTGAYPQDWVIGPDGVVVYANNRFELAELTAAIESQLD